MDFHGMQVQTSVYLTRPETREVPRSWRERLCAWPWRPWRATKIVTVQVPSDDVFVIGNGTVVMHPATLEMLRQRLGGPQ
jgi:hypothetical protein